MHKLFSKKFLSVAMVSMAFLYSHSSLAQDYNSELIEDAESLALDAKHYSEIYGVSEAEAMKRLLIMHGSQEEIASLELEYGNELAGLYFDNGEEFSVNVLLTSDNPPRNKTLTRQARKEARAEAKQARKNSKFSVSESDIDKAIEAIEQPTEVKVKFKGNAKNTKRKQVNRLEEKNKEITDNIEGLVGSYYSQREGIIVIQVNEDEVKNSNYTQEDIQKTATQILGLPVRVELTKGQAYVHSMKGGSSLRNSSGRGMCTTGLVVKDRTTGEVGIVTAGHCSDSQYTYTDKDGSKFLLKVKKRQLDSKNDMAFYVPTTKQTAEPKFYADGSSVARKLTGFVSVSSTREKTSSQPGSFICHYGQTTDMQSCGEVVDKTYAPNIPTGCGAKGSSFVACGNNFVLVEPKWVKGQNDLKCLRGDSGGPWFAYGNAYGIHKGGIHPKYDDPTTTIDDRDVCLGAFYTPIARINDMDLTLFYGY